MTYSNVSLVIFLWFILPRRNRCIRILLHNCDKDKDQNRQRFKDLVFHRKMVYGWTYIPTLQPHSNKINKRKEVVEDTDLNNYPD